MDNQSFVPNGYPISDTALVSALDEFMRFAPITGLPVLPKPIVPVRAKTSIEVAKIKVDKPKAVEKIVGQKELVKKEIVKEVQKTSVVEPKREEVKKVEPAKESIKEEEIKDKVIVKPATEKTEKVESKKEDEPKILPVEKLVPQENYRESPEFYEIANYFHVHPTEFEEAKHKLSLIYDWAAFQTQSSKSKDILTQIRTLEYELPAPTEGEKRYQNVFRFVKLAQT